MLSLIKDSGCYPKGTEKEGHAMIGFPFWEVISPDTLKGD